MLVEEFGELSVYQTFDHDLCQGDLNRIELQWEDLQTAASITMPQTDLILYDYAAQTDELPMACNKSFPIGGCARSWGARSTPLSALHELTHVVMLNKTTSVPPAVMLEGFAELLGGEPIALHNDVLNISIQMLMEDSASSHQTSFRADAHHVMAWAMSRHGLAKTLEVYQAAGDRELHTANEFAAAYGYEDMVAMQADYEATAAFEYPAWRDDSVQLTLDELASGVDLTPTCGHAGVTMTPTGLRMSVTFEILEPSRYALSYSGLSPSEFEPKRVSVVPRFETRPIDYDPVDNWGSSICFWEAGTYRITFEREAADEEVVFVLLSSDGSLEDCP